MTNQAAATLYIAKKPDANGYIHYTAEENAVWKTLYLRQVELIKDRACAQYFAGVETLGLSADHIPQCNEVSAILTQKTGWSVKPVEALISFAEFFELLANRQFPAASFIRRFDELDYLKEPDIFHELFGHCPLLTNQAFADFTHAVGILGVKLDKLQRAQLARLYWFTVEFGLINTAQGLRIYGGGILSSKTETVYALESDIPLRRSFDLLEILRTPYRYDELQKTYFIINSFTELFHLMSEDLLAYFAKAKELGLLAEPELMELRSC
jgi:phenylalanine-4-hydroxylase